MVWTVDVARAWVACARGGGEVRMPAGGKAWRGGTRAGDIRRRPTGRSRRVVEPVETGARTSDGLSSLRVSAAAPPPLRRSTGMSFRCFSGPRPVAVMEASCGKIASFTPGRRGAVCPCRVGYPVPTLCWSRQLRRRLAAAGYDCCVRRRWVRLLPCPRVLSVPSGVLTEALGDV